MVLSSNKICDAQSILSREESASVKGVYILLIVLGHNYIFTHATQSLQIMVYIYMFHIAGFFMLPYLYGSKEFTLRNIGNNAVRLLWPFFILAFVFFFGYYIIIRGHGFRFEDFMRVFVEADGWTLSVFCGFQVLWFLPSMFLNMIIHDLYFKYRSIIGPLLILSAVALMINIINPNVSIFRSVAGIIYSAPWTLWAALLYGCYGLICRELLIRTRNMTLLVIACGLVAIGVSVLYFTDIPSWGNNMAGDRWGRVLYPVAFMIPVVVASPKLCKMAWLRWFGENSLLVYLIHPFIGFGIMYLFPDVYKNPVAIQIIAIVLSLAAILGITVLLVVIIKRCGPLYRFLFPRNIDQWCEIWQRK